MNGKKNIIIISEAGWQGARELSIELSKRIIAVAVLIKGSINKDEKNMITRYRGINNIFIPQKLFAFISYIYAIYCSICLKRLFIFATKEKTEKNILRLKKVFNNINLAKLREDKGHFVIFNLDMKPIDYRDFLQIL